MAGWYAKIVKDLAYLPACIDHFDGELYAAREDVKISGLLEKQSSRLPGIVEQRFGQLQEIEAILEHLNIMLRQTRSKTFRKYLESYQRQLSSRDVDKYVDGDDDVIMMERLVNEFAIVRNQWLGVIKGLDTKGFQINNIIKLRAAGLEDASL